MLRYCLPVLFAVLLLSCLSEPDCIITSSSNVIISFRWPTGDSARHIKFDSIRVIGTDSIFHVGDTTDVVMLPIDPGNYQTKFRFYYETKEDSITVTYTRATRVISPSCGAFNHYQDLDVPMYSFLSLTIVNDQLSTSEEPNLRIKF